MIYNHRLYSHYGTRTLFAWLAELDAELGPSFDVIVTNPTSDRSPARRRLDSSADEILDELRAMPFVKIVRARSRSEYTEIVRTADIGLSPLRSGALWSMAVVDVMSEGIPVLGYRHGAIPELIGDPALLFSGQSEFHDMALRLLTDEGLRRRKGEQAQARSVRWSPERISQRVSGLLYEALEEAS
jgi:glycosyltransferase involved in cell wall biosynthesis